MSEAPNRQRCGKCGAALSGYAPDGLCAACLLESAFEEGDPGTSGQLKPGPLLTFNDYELLEEIARGGMGVVYRARQISLNRTVAIKMILGGHLANAAEMQRFRAEAETAAHLQHPNIVAIHQVGEHAGQPFFSMDLVEGRNLAQLVRDEPLPSRKAAAYVKTIAEAVQYAHAHGVLHRDLKPSNILIDDSDQPRITDFGLAKRLNDSQLSTHDPQLTQTGQVLGSPSFIPPEQAAGQKDMIGPASDVYSLGAILYHCLTARPPFVAETMTATLRMVAENEAVSPRLLNVSVPRDLETICLKCLEKDPRRRYATAQELADELGRFLSNKPIHARPVNQGQRIWLWCRRHPGIAGLTGLVALLLVTVAVVSTVSVTRLRRANRDGQERLRESLLAQAHANRWSGRPGRRFDSLDALRKAAEIRPGLDLRNEAIAAMALVDLRPVKEWETRDWAPFVFDAAYARFATTNGTGDVVVRDVNGDRELMTFPEVQSPVRELGFSPDGQYLAVRFGESNSWTHAYDLRTKAIVVEFTNAPPGAFCFSPDGRSLAIGQAISDANPTVRIYDLPTRREVISFESDWAPEAMKFSPAGERLALLENWGSQIQIRHTQTGAMVQTLDHPKAVSSFDWHPQGHHLVASSFDRLVHVWDFTPREQREMKLSHGDVAILAFYSHQGNLLASVGWNNILRFWNATSGRELLAFPALGYRGCPFSNDDRWIAYWAGQHKVCLGALASGREFRAVSFGDTLAGGEFCDFALDGLLPALMLRVHLRLWDEKASQDIARVPEEGVTVAKYDKSGHHLLTGGVNGLKRWPIKRRDGATTRDLEFGPAEELDPRGTIQGVWLVHQRERLLVLQERSVHLLDSTTCRPVSQFRLDTDTATSDASLDGKWFAGEMPDTGKVRVWNIEDERAVVDLPSSAPTGLSFTADSNLLLVGSPDAYVAWQVNSWKPRYSIPRPNSGGMRACVAFSQDGTVGAATYRQDSIQLFDPTSGHELATLEAAEPSVIVNLRFSPDGGQLTAQSGTSGTHFWDLRLLRRQLAALRLDWDAPPLPAPRHDENAPRPWQITFFRVSVAPRSAGCTPRQIDLTRFYNATLTNSWFNPKWPQNDLSTLPGGLQTLDGVQFDIRGVVQLATPNPDMAFDYPTDVTGITVGQRCHTLHFLHADGWAVEGGVCIGDYVIRYEDGVEQSVPLVHAENTWSWWGLPGQTAPMKTGTTLAWRGRNPLSDRANMDLLLFHFRWENPRPTVAISSFTFRSRMTHCAPFLIAVTAE